MAKEVILMSEVEGLGKEGEVVKVADGYARNYLFPKKIAEPVTEATRRKLDKRRSERKEQEAATFKEAQDFASRLADSSCTVAVKAGPDGKLFGSVSAGDIADCLKQQGLAIDKKKIVLPEALRELGVFKVDIHLHPEVSASLKVWVVEE